MSQVPPPPFPHTKASTRGRGAALSDHKQKYTKTFCSKAVEGKRERWHLSFYCILAKKKQQCLQQETPVFFSYEEKITKKKKFVIAAAVLLEERY